MKGENQSNSQRRHTHSLLTRSLFALALASAVCAMGHAVSISEFSAAPNFNGPNGATPISITSGADGNLWFAASTGGAIGRITPAGNVTLFPIPASPPPPGPFGPTAIAAGPDGNLWFIDPFNQAIGKMTTGGTITEFPVANPFDAPFSVGAIAAGPDGNVWVTKPGSHGVSRITPSGTITDFPNITSWPSTAIGRGADGNLWVTENNTVCGTDFCTGANATIARITPSGAVTEFPVPTAESFLYGIAQGPDGNIWFTESQGGLLDIGPAGGKIGKITPSGTITEYATPTDASVPTLIASGPDGNMWFTESHVNQIGVITPAGAISEFPIPTADSGPAGITAGSDGNIWFTEGLASQIGKLVPTGSGIKIDGYISGNWFNPAQSGHGFQLEVAQDNTMIAIWFVFAPDGSGQNWIYAQGTYDPTSSTVTLPAMISSGAKFPPNFNPNDVTRTPWGTITFSFSDCGHGTASWNSTLPGYGSGALPIVRLTQIRGTTCP
jgi:streptogramin lyase